MRVSSSASVAMSAPVRLRRRAAFTANHQSADPPLGFGDRDADVLVVVQEHGDPLEEPLESFATDFGLVRWV
jgi:hypothetical protein